MVRLLAATALALMLLGTAADVRATDIQRIVTPAGNELWYAHDARIPVISLALAFRGGAALDPEGKEGLATFTTRMLGEGAGDLDSSTFQQAVENRAIALAFDAGRDVVTATMSTVSAHREEAFRLLGLALSAPRFDAAAVERVRRQILTAIAQNAQTPHAVANRVWFETVFPDHPYGRPVNGTAESVSAIGDADLHRFAETRLARGNAVAAAAGDVSADEIARLLDGALAGLADDAAPGNVNEAALQNLGGTLVVERPLPQTVITFGMPGLARSDEDFYAAYVMNHILGGGSTSRLYREIRDKRGLAYGVYSYLAPLDRAGLYLGGVATRNDRAAETVAVLRDEIARLAAEGVTDEELSAAKRHLTGAFPLRFDSGRRIAAMLTNHRLDGLGIDYVDRRNDLIEAVTRADVARAAKRLLRPDLLTLVLVGTPDAVEPTL